MYGMSQCMAMDRICLSPIYRIDFLCHYFFVLITAWFWGTLKTKVEELKTAIASIPMFYALKTSFSKSMKLRHRAYLCFEKYQIAFHEEPPVLKC